MSVITMVNSVDEYVAGEEYEVEDETADRFILLGYANGRLARVHGDDEIAVLQAENQTVGV